MCGIKSEQSEADFGGTETDNPTDYDPSDDRITKEEFEDDSDNESDSYGPFDDDFKQGDVDDEPAHGTNPNNIGESILRDGGKFDKRQHNLGFRRFIEFMKMVYGS